MHPRTKVIDALIDGLAAAEDVVDVNVAAGTAQIDLKAAGRQSLVRTLWAVVLLLLLSDLLPIGPLELGLLPDVHILQHLTGHAYAVDAGHALYHVDKLDHPHVLGVKLPWGSLF